MIWSQNGEIELTRHDHSEKPELLQVDKDSGAIRCWQFFSITTKVGCTVYLCESIFLSFYKQQMKVRSVPLSHRTIDININFPLPDVESRRNFISRIFGGDEDKDEENDNKNEENDKDNKRKENDNENDEDGNKQHNTIDD